MCIIPLFEGLFFYFLALYAKKRDEKVYICLNVYIFAHKKHTLRV